MDVEKLLYEEFKGELEELKSFPIDSEGYKIHADLGLKYADRLIELQKIEAERASKAIDREIEMEMKLEQLKEDRRARRIRDGIAIATFVGSAAICIWGNIGTWRFDAENTSTSTNGRTFMNGLYPKCLKL